MPPLPVSPLESVLELISNGIRTEAVRSNYDICGGVRVQRDGFQNFLFFCVCYRGDIGMLVGDRSRCRADGCICRAFVEICIGVVYARAVLVIVGGSHLATVRVADGVIFLGIGATVSLVIICQSGS